MGLQYQVEVQPAALRDMRQIVTYVAKRLKNPQAAERLAQELTDGIKTLTTLPSRCPLHMPLRPLKPEYRKLAVGNYLVFFSVSEEDELVTVAGVLYGRRRVDSQLGICESKPIDWQLFARSASTRCPSYSVSL